MGISMSALNRARRVAHADMRTRCRVTRLGSGETWNPETLQYEPAAAVTTYEGPCKVRRTGSSARSGEAAGQLFLENALTLSLPMIGSESVGKDNDVVILSSLTDPALVGARFRIEKAEAYDNGTSRRFTLERVQ